MTECKVLRGRGGVGRWGGVREEGEVEATSAIINQNPLTVSFKHLTDVDRVCRVQALRVVLVTPVRNPWQLA